MGLKEKSGIRLCFLGHGYEDILLYLTGILNRLGSKMHIIDRTKEHDFYYFIPHIEGIDPSEKNLDIVNAFYSMVESPDNGLDPPAGSDSPAGLKQDHQNQSKGDTIILYDYSNIPELTEKTIIVTDERRKNLEFFEANKDKLKGEKTMIIREYSQAAGRKIEETAFKLGIQKVYVLPVSGSDRKAYLLAGYTGKIHMAGISRDLKMLLEELIRMLIPDVDNKALKKAVKTCNGY